MSRLFICTATRKQSETYKRYAMFFVHRHSFLKLKRSALLIQRAVRNWISWRHQQARSLVAAATTVQRFVRGRMARCEYIRMLDQKEKASDLYQQNVKFDLQTKAAIRIQLTWKKYLCCKSTQKHFFATKIQSNYRRWQLRRRYFNQIQAILRIQSYFRMSRCVKSFQHFKIATKAAVVIQSSVRAWIARREAYARRNHIVEIQVRHCSFLRFYFLLFDLPL